MPLTALPPELYSAILAQVDRNELQRTTLALTRAIPRAPVPQHHLFTCIRLRAPERIVQLHRRLRTAKNDTQFVLNISIETWTSDPQVVINLLALLENVRRLVLFVGPNFAPEDLEEILIHPRDTLQELTLRFRPYVKRANYYHFLKGAYFDSALIALANWPSSKCSIQNLSIIQDPYKGLANSEAANFAQPIVFFALHPLLSLSVSPMGSKLTRFKLRIPARDVSSFIAASPRTLLKLELLDISTCNIGETQLERLLVQLPYLKHIVLDDCGLLRHGHSDDSPWASLGKTCALVGVKRAREREKEIRAWQETSQVQGNALLGGQATAPQVVPQGYMHSKPGRKGLATAAISLRQPPTGPLAHLPTAIAVSPTAAASRTPNIKVRVIPSPPSLMTISTTAPSIVDERTKKAICDEFTQGWMDGVSQLRATWRRLRTSQRNGVKVVCISSDAQPSLSEFSNENDQDCWKGLADVGSSGTLSWTDLEDKDWPCPILCLSCDESNTRHAHDCGHRAFGDVQDRELL